MTDTPHTPTPWDATAEARALAHSLFAPIDCFAFAGREQSPPRHSRNCESAVREIEIVLRRARHPAHDDLVKALQQWKCTSCGGTGSYQQNKVGRERNEERGKPLDPKYHPDPVSCKVCGGLGIHPVASSALAKAGGAS